MRRSNFKQILKIKIWEQQSGCRNGPDDLRVENFLQMIDNATFAADVAEELIPIIQLNWEDVKGAV